MNCKSDDLSISGTQHTGKKSDELELRKEKLEQKVRLFDSFMKVLVAVIVLHGLCCVTASYVLAWYGIMEPLQSLSETIAREIAAPVITYGLTKTVENISKYNDWIERYLYGKHNIPEKELESEQANEIGYR